MRTLTTAILGAALLASTACQDTPMSIDAIQPDLARTGPASSATYQVTVTNLTGGQPFTPPLAVTHRRPLELFEVGAAATLGVREIAENGNLAPLAGQLTDHQHVADLVIAGGSPPPILPGSMRTFTISSDRGAKYLSFVSMLICTNDGFTGVNAARLPGDIGESITLNTMAYDAGSEVNTEDFADMVPPCAPLTGVPSSDAGTGASDPALAEGGVVHPHAGIAGVDDLLPSVHGWTGPVAVVEVTRIS